MLELAKPKILRAFDEPAIEAVLTHAELLAVSSFWEYRAYMNPRLTLRDMWFPRSLAWKLREFWNAMKEGKRPIQLIQTPPQHGKSAMLVHELREQAQRK